MKFKSQFLMLACAAFVFAFTPTAQAKDYLSIATGGTSGTYYPIGGAIAKVVSEGGTLQVTAETGNASVANINLVAAGEIEVAFAQNDIAYWAYNGQQMFNMPQWFVVSVFGSGIVAIVGIIVLVKTVFIDFDYDEEAAE